WNVSRTAAQLGISRNTLRHRIAKYGLVPPVSAPFRRGGRHELRKSTRPLPQTGVSDSKAERAVDEIRYEHRVLGFLRIAAEPSDISSRIVDVVEKVSMYGGRVVERGSSGILAVFGFGAGENPVLAAAFAAMAKKAAASTGFSPAPNRSEEHTSELQSRSELVCRLLLEKKKKSPE